MQQQQQQHVFPDLSKLHVAALLHTSLVLHYSFRGPHPLVMPTLCVQCSAHNPAAGQPDADARSVASTHSMQVLQEPAAPPPTLPLTDIKVLEVRRRTPCQPHALMLSTLSSSTHLLVS